MTNGNQAGLHARDPMAAQESKSAPVLNTVFDDICANLEDKMDRLLGMNRNLQGKIDRMVGSLPPEVAGEETVEASNAGISRTHHTLERMQAIINRLEIEIARMDAFAG
jgi:hypothetical protein